MAYDCRGLKIFIREYQKVYRKGLMIEIQRGLVSSSSSFLALATSDENSSKDNLYNMQLTFERN